MKAIVQKLAGSAMAVLLGCSTAYAEARPLALDRADGSVINAFLSMPDNGSPEGLIVLAQGSGCLSVQHSDNLSLLRRVVANLWGLARADAAVLVSTGGGRSFGEMVRQSILDDMERHGVPPEHWPPVDSIFEEVRANPHSTEIWAGSSFRFWADAIDRRIVDFLLEADTRFLLIQGGRDTATPVEMARGVADRFAEGGRCNLVYWEFSTLDHGMVDPTGISQMEKVSTMAAEWVRQQISGDDGACA